MKHSSSRFVTVAFAALAFVGLVPATGLAQDSVPITRLGGPNSFHKPPLTTPADVIAMVEARRADIETVLAAASWNGNTNDLIKELTTGTAKEIEFPIGDRLFWMALRKTENRKKVPAVLTNPTWAGKAPFAAYEYTFLSNDWLHTFVIPKACGNLALRSQIEAPPPVAMISITPAKDCISRTLTIDASKSSVRLGKLTGVMVEVKKPDGKSESLEPGNAGSPRWTRNYEAPGVYTFTAVATDDWGRRSKPAIASGEMTPCPPTAGLSVAPNDRLTGEIFTIDGSTSRAEVGTIKLVKVEVIDSTGAVINSLELAGPFKLDSHLDRPGLYTFRAVAIDSFGQESAPLEATIRILSRLGIVGSFFGGTGAHRRELESNVSAVCTSPSVGARVGLRWLTSQGFELLGGVGYLLNTRDSSYSGVFFDFEGNALFDGGMAGVGVGVWDLNRSASRAVSAHLHGGIDVGHAFGEPVYLYLEGRVPLDDLGDVANNYSTFLGLRFTSR